MPTDIQRVFTDDVLHAIEMDAEAEIEMNGTYEIDGNDFYALLTRLQAAERYIEVGALTQSVNPTELAIAELNWRKAAGKLV